MDRTLEENKQDQYYSQASLSRFDESQIILTAITFEMRLSSQNC
jgi:hypothetical protein